MGRVAADVGIDLSKATNESAAHRSNRLTAGVAGLVETGLSAGLDLDVERETETAPGCGQISIVAPTNSTLKASHHTSAVYAPGTSSVPAGSS